MSKPLSWKDALYANGRFTWDVTRPLTRVDLKEWVLHQVRFGKLPLETIREIANIHLEHPERLLKARDSVEGGKVVPVPVSDGENA